MQPSSPPGPPPTDWQSRCNLAASILSWRPPNSLTGTLARKALEGYSIEQLMAFERGVKADRVAG